MPPIEEDFDVALSPAQQTELMGRIMRDLQRAGRLGLLPKDGARVSVSGEYIIEPSNIEEDENKKMRGYRYKEFPRSVYGWGLNPNQPEAGEGPLDLRVRNRAELDNALAAGWSDTPLAGPSGKLDALGQPVEAEPDVDEVRTFAPPGQLQPHDDAVARVAPKKRGRKPGVKPTKKAVQ